MAPRQLAYLRALGVDAWVRRELLAKPPAGRTPDAASDASNAAAARLPASPAPRRATPSPAAGAEPAAKVEPAAQFVIRCFRQGDAFALVDEPLWRHRRLLGDIAHAMDASGADEREEFVFEWPQLKGSANAGMSAAGRAFRAFLRAQSTPRIRWLAVGARVAALAAAEVDGNVHIVLPDALDAIDKRALWREIASKR